MSRLIDADALLKTLDDDPKGTNWHDHSGDIYDAVIGYVQDAPTLWCGYEVKRMTTEEAIDILNNTAWLGSDNGIRVYPAVKMAMTALINQSKYKWHDLRKDPTDLPHDMAMVLLCFRGGDNDWYEVMFYDARRKVFSLYSCTEFEKKRKIGQGFGDVIAWKEIETFEVEKDA